MLRPVVAISFSFMPSALMRVIASPIIREFSARASAAVLFVLSIENYIITNSGGIYTEASPCTENGSGRYHSSHSLEICSSGKKFSFSYWILGFRCSNSSTRLEASTYSREAATRILNILFIS